MKGTFKSRGTTLSFRDTGKGQTVVFLHPTPLDREYWRPMAEGLAGVRAIIPDLRGHGESELGPVDRLPVGEFARLPDAPALTMKQLAADVLALLDHLKIEQAVFAGCSIGGYVLLELWRQAPARVTGLAFVCSRPQGDAEANLDKRAENIANVRANGTGPLFDGMAKSLVGKTAQQRRPAIVDQLRARMTVSADGAVAVQAGLAIRPDSVSTIFTITAPVLAIAGGEDPTTSQADMEAYNGAPGGCEFHFLPDAGHFAAYEQPEKVAALLAEWLRQPEE